MTYRLVRKASGQLNPEVRILKFKGCVEFYHTNAVSVLGHSHEATEISEITGKYRGSCQTLEQYTSPFVELLVFASGVSSYRPSFAGLCLLYFAISMNSQCLKPGFRVPKAPS
jgi:hypothetical protein